ncbi:3 5 -cyclic nucleotide phosphodiesterase domain-containing protein [Cystoisospora suis]|uniref:3 5-cyclic nucleotide phosphodiesterase domain-containing protein n=1 Tax=Cystoisospora suis TaxID=483139 RepID=A0A2C6LF62_9APIC|nr:3 5 -cyclic nucleotide phosphodiesterase domain-containing protein [Cystoisospora suis]
MDDQNASSSLRMSQPSAVKYAASGSTSNAARQRPLEKHTVSFSQHAESQHLIPRTTEPKEDLPPSVLSSLQTRMTAALSEGGPGRAVSGSAPSAAGSDSPPHQLKSILVKRGSQEGQTPQETEETPGWKGSTLWSRSRSFFGRRRWGGCWEKFQDVMMPFWENEVDFVLKEESERQAFAGKMARPIRSKAGSESKRSVKVQESGVTAKSTPSGVSATSTLSNFTLKRRPLRSNMDFFGLRFRDKKMEEEYEFNNNRLFKYRNCFTGTLCLTVSLANYIILLMAQRTKAYMLGSLAPVIGFHLILNSSIICSLIFTFVHRLPFTKDHQEQVTYFLISTAYATVALVVCVTKFQLYWGPSWDSAYLKFLPDTLTFYDVATYLPIKDPVDPRFALYIVLNELLLTSITDSYYYFLTLLFDSVIPGRSRYIVIHQTVMICLSIVVTFIGVAKYPLLVYPALFRLMTMLLCYVAGLSGQFAVEVQRRGLFFEWYVMRKKLTEIQREKKKAQKKHATSGLDDLRSFLVEIRNVSLQAKVRCKEYDPTPEINQILELVEKGLDLLANSWNLYSVEVDESLKQEGFMKALDVDTKAKRVVLADPEAPLPTRTLMPLSREVVTAATTPSFEAADSSRVLSGVHATAYTTQLVPVIGIDIGFDMLELSRSCPSTLLLEVGYVLLSRNVADWACEDRVLRQFLHTTQGLYRDNPYHSAIHGAMVAHTMGCLLRALGVNRE